MTVISWGAWTGISRWQNDNLLSLLAQEHRDLPFYKTQCHAELSVYLSQAYFSDIVEMTPKPASPTVDWMFPHLMSPSAKWRWCLYILTNMVFVRIQSSCVWKCSVKMQSHPWVWLGLGNFYFCLLAKVSNSWDFRFPERAHVRPEMSSVFWWWGNYHLQLLLEFQGLSYGEKKITVVCIWVALYCCVSLPNNSQAFINCSTESYLSGR